jgi:uncharacterized membrane protein YidH (DUF202 family)
VSRSTRRQRSISFSEEIEPDSSLPTTFASGPSHQEAAVDHGVQEAAVSAQDHDRDQNQQRKTSHHDQSSSISPPSASSGSPKKSWYHRLASNYHSISLENKGSVARDHLALERTFLAWLRTSLAFASIGIAITQLFRLNASLADQKQRRRIRGLNSLTAQNEAASSLLPLSPLMGASLTPEICSHLQSLLQQQQYPINAASDNGAVTLLDQFLQPAEFDPDAAARLRHLGKPLGATFLGISIVILFIGFHRYFESQHWIIRGQFPASRGSVALTGIVAVMLIVASLVVVLVVAPRAYST